MTAGRDGAHHAVFEVPTGWAIAVCHGESLARLSLFSDTGTADAALDALDARSTRDDSAPGPERVRGQLGEYFAGRRREFDLPLSLGGTPFQQSVWRALREIPFGSTTTYGALAERLGRPGAMRAVGAANGRNPAAIVIPCHRVIGADGSLTGYAGGLPIKRALLAHEGALPAARPTLPLFDRAPGRLGAAGEPDLS